MIDGGSGEDAPKSDRRSALIHAAFHRIASEGFEGLRTRDVAADVGVNIATLHYYFPTKEALIRGVIGDAMHRFITTMQSDGSAVERLRGHLRAVAVLLKQDQELWAVMGELVLRAPRDPDLGRIFRQTDEYWHRMLRELIQQSVDEGVVQPVLQPDDLATLMMVSLRGMGLPTVAGFQPELIDRLMRQFEILLDLPPERNAL